MHLNADERRPQRRWASRLSLELQVPMPMRLGQTACMPRPLGRYTHQRSSYAQLCRSMPHSKIAGVEKHPCGSDTRHVGPSGRVAALIFEAQAAPLELGDGMLWEPCPISPLPCPCLILARVRLPFRLATMASSACIASSQAAPAMPAAASGAPVIPAQSSHAHTSAFTVLSIATIA